MTKKELVKRYVLFMVGLFISALGISFISKAQLGMSAISSLPYTISLGLPITLGTSTFFLNMALILGQIALLKKDFDKIQLMQIPISVLFGYFIDFTLSLIYMINPSNYIQKILYLSLGCAMLALGVSMQVIANVVLLSGEALVKAIAFKCHKEFGATKVCFDVTLVVTSVVVSLVMFKKILGVREGTVIAAVTVGLMVKFFCKRLQFINTKFLIDKSSAKDVEIIDAG